MDNDMKARPLLQVEEPAEYGNRIVQYSMDYSLCAGCETCSMMCAISHDGIVSPGCSRIQVNLGTRSMIHEVLTCQHCKDHPCYEKCPKKGSAMSIDENGVVFIDEENCIGCGLCIKACKFNPPRIAMMKNKERKKWKAKKCDMCRDNPEGPQCIAWCPVRCIGLSHESVYAEEKIMPKSGEGSEANA